MLKLNKIVHFYDITSGNLVLNQSRKIIPVPDMGTNHRNLLVGVRRWASANGLIEECDSVMLG